MTVCLNGQFVSEEQAVVSVFDRGFLYGDGLFETVRVRRGRLFRWDDHLRRLERGAEFLRLRVPATQDELTRLARELIRRNAMPEATLRLALSRGVSQRGYSIAGAGTPTLCLSLYPPPPHDPHNPPRWKLITSSFRVPTHDRLALYKTCNKLPHILARAEAEARGADDALLLNTDGEVAEATSANFFWVVGDTVFTPPLSTGVLAGITRALVLELCRTLDIPCLERSVRPKDLSRAGAMFVTLSTLGVVEVGGLDHLAPRGSPVVASLRRAYEQLVERATAPA